MSMEEPCQERVSAAGLVMLLLAELTELKIPWVYLRGYEGLPDEIFNDVDILIPIGKSAEVADHFLRRAMEEGWSELYRAKFGPLAQYFVNPENGDVLHLDLFERLSRKFVPFCNEEEILGRRRWNGLVNIPSEPDENFINVMTRLLYHGVVREKHRVIASRLHKSGDGAVAFVDHLGTRGKELYDQLAETSWIPQ